jgi:gliding motility-associated-like protein
MKNNTLIRKLIAVKIFVSFFYTATSQCTADFTFQQNVCSPKTISFASSLTGVQSFTWNFGNNVTNTSTLNPTFTYATFGTFSVSLTVTYTNGCTFTRTKPVAVLAQQDNDLITTPNSAICIGDSIFLQTAAIPGNFCWYTAAGTVNNSSQNIYVSPVNPTTYYFVSQLSGGELVTNGNFNSGNTGFTSGYTYCNAPQCISEGGYVIGNNPQFYHVDFSGNDHTTGTGNFMMVNGALTPDVPVWCETITVTPNTNYTFSTWISTVAGEYAPAQLQFNINNVPVGPVATAPATIHTWTNHSATWNSGSATSASICIVSKSDWFGGNDFGLDDISFGTGGGGVSIDSVTIGIHATPQLQVGADPNICKGATTQINAITDASSVAWTPAAFLSNPGIPDPQVINLQSTTTFYIQAGTGSCIKNDSVTVFVYEKPVVTITPVNSICNGSSVVLQAQATHAGSYTWSPATGLSDPHAASPSASPDATTSYTVIANNNSCADTAVITVNVNSAPDIIVNKSNDIDCAHSVVTLTATGATGYSWYPTDFLTGNPASGQVEVNPDHSITYYVQGTGSNGCIGKDSVSVNFYKSGAGNVYVPSAFTPNGDNNNDVFKVIVKGGFRKFELRIFDRWGELVFFTNNPAVGWNGTYKALHPLAGTYVYWIKIDADCSAEFIKGSVILIK